MKAFILAAGFGTRLRPMTDHTPKPLVPVGGKPLLFYHLESLSKHGVTEVLINTHYLADTITAFVNGYRKNHPGLQIHLTYEPELLGSAGTIKTNKNFFAGENEFIVTYGDNLTNVNYGNLVEHHRTLQGLATIVTWDEPNVEAKSMVVAAPNFRVQQFVEKPKTEQVVVRRSGGGVYVFDAAVTELLDSLDGRPLDIGFHVLPALVGQRRGVYEYPLTGELLLDIGTPESYNKAQEIIKTLQF